MQIIPAIDIIDGKCVRLTQGNYSSCKIYSNSPLDIAKQYEESGITRLHLVDLDGAKATGVINIGVLESVCKGTSLSVDFGGGIKSDDDICKVFDAGADYACIGSIAQSKPSKVSEWITAYGGDKLIIGADVWNTKICVNGWKKVTDTTIYDLIDSYQGMIHNLMCTDISKDGMLQGVSVELYKDLLRHYPGIHLIASGGVSSTDDLDELVAAGIPAVVVGKAIYENRITLDELSKY